MRKNCCTPVAPSMAAASYSESGMSCSAASRMIMLKPIVHQTVAIRMAIQAQGRVESQRG